MIIDVFLQQIGFGDLLYLSNNKTMIDLMEKTESGSYPRDALKRIRFFYDVNIGLKRAIKNAKMSLKLDDFEFMCYENQMEVEGLDDIGRVLDNIDVVAEVVLHRMIQDKIEREKE